MNFRAEPPHFHQLGRNNVNCDYADDIWECKNAYLSRGMANCEDMYYVYRCLHSKNNIDITYCYEMEQCYEVTYGFKCYNLKHSLNCHECSDSWFLYDCRSCKNCFMCWNLRNKEYCILNEQYSKEDYETKLKDLHLNSRHFLSELRQQFRRKLREKAIHRADENMNSENCSGNYITDSKNCHDSYFVEYGEDCRYIMRSPYLKDCQDITGMYRGELSYQTAQCTDLVNVQHAIFSVDCSGSYYLDQCYNCKNCFGCVGLKRREYCIFNRQYKKEEYGEMIKKIINHMKETGEWGEFFPYKFAYNGFNLSFAANYYNETEESIKRKGGFFEPEKKIESKGMPAEELPDRSGDISEDYLKKHIQGAETGQLFNFIKQEIDFYKKHNLPLPIYYPEVRNKKRFNQMTPLKGRKTKCHFCEKEIMTYYPEEWDYQRIACEHCYLKTVY